MVDGYDRMIILKAATILKSAHQNRFNYTRQLVFSAKTPTTRMTLGWCWNKKDKTKTNNKDIA